MSETKGDLFRKEIKDSLKDKPLITKKTKLPKGEMLNADGESVRKEFQNRYGKNIEKKVNAKKMEPAKLKSGGRVNYGSGGKACAQIKGFGKARRPNKR